MATWKQVMAANSMKIAEKISVNMAKRDIVKLYKKWEESINRITNDIGVIIELEDERKDKQMIAMICSRLMTGFESKQEMMMTCDMIKTTLEQYCINEKIPDTIPIKK